MTIAALDDPTTQMAGFGTCTMLHPNPLISVFMRKRTNCPGIYMESYARRWTKRR
jgi:hypothetical protein